MSHTPIKGMDENPHIPSIKMPIRLATWSDLLPASKLLAAAFHNDDLFGHFVHPCRNEFPEDVYLYWLRFLREAYWTEPGEFLAVSYSDDGAVTGVAHWIRNYSSPPPVSWTSWFGLQAVKGYNRVEDLVWPNRAIDHTNDAVIAAGNPFFMHHWTGSRADSWLLSLLGVDPEYEKQRYGRLLVSWGFERSVKEGVSCSVISVPGQEGFYRACGFDKVVGTTNDEGGEANAWRKAGLEAAPILICDHGVEPRGVKGYGEE